MYIYAQDKKSIGTYQSITVERNLGGGKAQKYAIMGHDYSGSGLTVLAAYPEEEEAVLALQRLFAAMQAGADTYTF